MPAEDLKHLPGAPESNDLALLLNCQCGQEDRHNTILPERHSELRMPGNLENKLAIALFVNQLPCRQSSDRQATQYERSRGKTKFLRPLLSIHLYKVNFARLAELLFGDDELAMCPPENGGRLLEAVVRG